VKLKRASMIGSLEPGHELAAEDMAEYLYGQKEGTRRADPTGVIRCQPAGSQHTMDMWVKQQALIPTVQYAEKADLRDGEDRGRPPVVSPRLSGTAG